MDRPVTTRRRFLATGFAGFGGALVLHLWRLPMGIDREPLVRFRSRFQNLESVELVGQEYLKRTPGENDLAVLLALVDIDRGAEAIELDIRSEYRKDDVVRVGGWPLSVSEARIYAIVALSKN